MDSLLGKNLNEYRLEQLLGQGGMARVYRGFDTVLKRYVAIKVIDAQFREDSEYARRFELEAQALAQLNHPNVVQLYRYGRVDDVLYMAMAYIQGSDVKAALDDYHSNEEFMAVDEALRILRETASALDYVHSQGIIHRDIKPGNIMLEKSGRAILTDFGLALMTQVGTMGEIFGTPQYLAPEQAISSAAVVPQSDLYSLGIIAYEIFTGQIPFDAPEPMTVALMQMNDVPPAPRSLRPELTEALEEVLLTALEKEPENRYQSGAEFVQALETAIKGDSALRRSSLPRLSIPQIVAIEMEKNPLPPAPAAVTPPIQKKSAEMPSITERASETQGSQGSTLPHQAPVTEVAAKPVAKPRTAPPPKVTSEQMQIKVKDNSLASYWPYALGGGLFALIVISAIFFFAPKRDNAVQPSATIEVNNASATSDLGATDTAIAAASATAASLSMVASPTVLESSPTVSVINTAVLPPTVDNSILYQSQTQAALNLTQNASIVIVPSNTPAPQNQSAQLRFTWEGDKWLLIENLGSSPVNLGLLSLTAESNESHALSGRSFGENLNLQVGQCVAFAKPNQINRLAPACNLVGSFAVEEGRDRIWKENFNVYYLNALNERPISLCDKDEAPCLINIVLGS